MREGERRWAVSSTIGESERASSTERGSSMRARNFSRHAIILSFLPPLSLSFYYYFYYSSYLLFNPSLPSTISYRFFYLVLPRNECFFFLPPPSLV